ncbi:MAG: hypothetical protein GY749_35360 [Desulfobacteraceae bacterium]|nr:hypothetical protein [Desulfobacteraceae bacterium]
MSVTKIKQLLNKTTPRSHALRGNAGRTLRVPVVVLYRNTVSGSRKQDAERPGCIPTQSVGTRFRANS